LIFQLSKVTEQILFHLRKELKLPPYITISPGPKDGVIGSIKQCYHLNDLIQIESLLGTSKNKYIILLDEADGTEEIPICVGGILLKHDLPQLSHLAIRARQAGILFVCCENIQVFTESLSRVQGLMGEVV